MAADLEDSNIANYGSGAHRDLRKDAAESEAEFKGAGTKPGIEVWRIEAFGVKRWKDVGTFYDGDSFIVLYTYKDKENKNKLRFRVHFWLGESTTQDEYGTAAYKTVELDDLLDDAPVQFREVQGAETAEFLALFPRMTVLAGGVESAFNHVAPKDYKPRLLHVKGKKNVVVRQVPLATKSLNDGDCYVLDAGLQIWQFNGTSSNHFERRKAAEMVQNIKDQRQRNITHAVIDGLEESADEFWAFFGGKPDAISPPTPDKDVYPVCKALYRLTDRSGKLRFSKECQGKLDRAKLDSDDVFVVDIGHNVFVWIGRRASAAEKKKAMAYAMKFLNEKDRPPATPCVRVIEGGETLSFNRAFDSDSGKHEQEGTEEGKTHGAPANANGKEGAVEVIVHAASGLRDTQTIGKQDPYVVVRAGDSVKLTSVDEDGGKEAKWADEKFVLPLTGVETEVLLVVKNSNLVFDAEIGRVSVPIDALGGRSAHDLSTGGSVDVTTRYVPPCQLKIVRASGLADKQTLGKQDPFVLVRPFGFDGPERVFKTPACEDGGTSPVWNEDNVFPFNLRAVDESAAAAGAHIEVINKNIVKNDEIAKGELSVDKIKAAVRGQAFTIDLQPQGQLEIMLV